VEGGAHGTFFPLAKAALAALCSLVCTTRREVGTAGGLKMIDSSVFARLHVALLQYSTTTDALDTEVYAESFLFVRARIVKLGQWTARTERRSCGV
jgi:hypothetical protein